MVKKDVLLRRTNIKEIDLGSLHYGLVFVPQFRFVEFFLQTPKRLTPKPIQRSLSKRNTDWLDESYQGGVDSSKPSSLFSNCLTTLLLASVILVAVSLTMMPLFFGGFGNLLFVQNLSFNQSVSKEQFIQGLSCQKMNSFMLTLESWCIPVLG